MVSTVGRSSGQAVGHSQPGREDEDDALDRTGERMFLTIILPLVLLAILAWLVPWLLSLLLPEGAVWLVVIGVVAAMILTGLSAVGFYVLYGPARETVLNEAPWYFVILSARAALLWGPILMLSLANIPRRWKTAVW